MAAPKGQKENLNTISDADFEKHKDFGENSRKEYEKIYTEMWSNLSEAHLEPFAKIMLERENKVLKGQDQLIDKIRKNVQKAMVLALNNFWQSYDVSEALFSLEICKEKFRGYEGHKWDIQSKTPEERTRPIRMRIKENRLRYMKAQLEYQQKELYETMRLNKALRQNIQDVKQQRIYLMENMTKHKKKLADAKEEMLHLQNQLLDVEENDIRKCLDKIKADKDDNNVE